jgi:23S rRNA pseudouridine2604 synthase
MTDEIFPMRINKYLAHQGFSTRAGADELVSAGKVTINGRRAVLGDKVLASDKVLVNAKNLNKDLMYLVYNKPVGIVTTNPVRGEKQIMDNPTLPKVSPILFPVGRLDKNSYGLVLLTNDGRVIDRLLNPKNDHEKEYVVEVAHSYTPAFVRHMQTGVDIGEYVTKPAKVSKVTTTKFRITLSEGKNRQIRRMTEKLGYTVTDLCRVRIQNLSLGKLGQGSWRALEDEEKTEFLKSIGL